MSKEKEIDRKKRLLIERMRGTKEEIKEYHGASKELVLDEQKILPNMVIGVNEVEKMSPEEITQSAEEAMELRWKAHEERIKEDEINNLSLEDQITKLNLNVEEADEFRKSNAEKQRKRYIASLNLKKLKPLDKTNDFVYSYDDIEPFEHLHYDDEPARMIGQDLEKFMIWAVANKASDVFIQSDEPIKCDIYGKKHSVTKQNISNPQVIQMISYIYKSESALSTLNGASDVDCQWSIALGKGQFLRFRINITAQQAYGTKGYEITIRTINGRAPLLETLDLPSRLLKGVSPRQGLILVSGATGSGKSTLLASILDWRLRDPHGHIKILAYEKPIEFVYDEVTKPTSLISQVEIGVHLQSFELGIVNALRRKPDIILVGEMRDKETIGEGITASMTGHLVYGTVHATTVANTILRMVNSFGAEEKDAKRADILGSLRMIIAQKLLPTVDGKRVAVREFLSFDNYVQDKLSQVSIENLIYETQKLVETRGQSFLDDITDKYVKGIISEKIYDQELITLGFKEI